MKNFFIFIVIVAIALGFLFYSGYFGSGQGDGIEVTLPAESASVDSPIKIEGQASGTWFFEGDFPVILFDENGREMARSYVTADGDWMTEDLVAFSGEISFTDPTAPSGYLEFMESDPSDGEAGEPRSFRVPVVFMKPGEENYAHLIFPNGGETWGIGSKQTIRWDALNNSEYDKVSISIRRIPPPALPESGQEFDPLVFVGIENDGEEEWVISDMYPEGKYILEVTAYSELPLVDGNHVSDESDASFEIIVE